MVWFSGVDFHFDFDVVPAVKVQKRKEELQVGLVQGADVPKSKSLCMFQWGVVGIKFIYQNKLNKMKMSKKCIVRYAFM